MEKTSKINNVDEVIDPQRNKEAYLRWDGKIEGVSASNEEIILKFITDMSTGMNVTGKRGPRSYIRLMNIRHRMAFLTRLIEKRLGGMRLVDLKDDNVMWLFNSMRNGQITKANGNNYQCVVDYVKVFKSFWHWYMKIMRRSGVTIEDITLDLDTSRVKAKFNYFTMDQLNELLNHSSYEYRVLMMFLFDTGIRAPKELYNVRAKDITPIGEDGYQVLIREASSKTFGRKVKLMLFPKQIAAYASSLQPDETLFSKEPSVVNQYLKRLGYKVLKIGTCTLVEEVNGKKRQVEKLTKGLHMYDFRHCSACYWLPKYPNEQALKYRFGWKKSDMIYYYTDYLGMHDTISEEHLIDIEAKTKLEKELDQQKRQNAVMEARIIAMEQQQDTLRQTIIEAAMEEIKTKLGQKTSG